MAIDLRTLKCNQCGSTRLQQVGPIHFQCLHCRTTTLVDHRPTAQAPSVRPMAAPMPIPRRPPPPAVNANKAVLIGFAALLGIGVVMGGIGALVGRAKGGASGRSGTGSAWSRRPATIDRKTLTVEARTVITGQGSSATPKVLVTMQNGGTEPVDDLGVLVTFFDGAKAAGTARASHSSFELMPGERHVVLLDMPKTAGDRQTAEVVEADPVDPALEGPALACSRARLVQTGTKLRFVCGVKNTQAQPLYGVRSFVIAYDTTKSIVGFGDDSARSEIAPNGDAVLAGDLTMLGSQPVASWEYRLRYELPGERSSRVPVTGPDRTVRVTAAPETWPDKMPLDDAALVATDAESYDANKLRVAEWQVGRDNVQNSVLLSEIKNPTTDLVVLGASGLVTPYDGDKAGESTAISAVSLYPGESFPVRVVPRGLDRLNRTVVRWAPARRMALPGPRSPLEIAVTSTKGVDGSVLVNFTRTYRYKSVEVQGTIKNTGKKVVAKPIVWVMLRDKSDRLAGFEKVEAGAVAPGDSIPFKTSIVQEGSAWTRVTTTYQTAE